jgi:FtsP/CotA-like multicopper oxidase with cupredoxin domain
MRTIPTFLFGLFALALGNSWTLAAESPPVRLPAAPELHGTGKVVELTLRAVSDADGHGAFSFNGQTVPPVIRVSPGDTLKITYINALSPTSRESCGPGRA